MRTLNILISDIEFRKFGLKKNNMSFSDLLDLVSKEITKRNLAESIELAEKNGLSKMSIAEISREVKAVRKNAKNHS